jgi:serine/threonine-protein kinase
MSPTRLLHSFVHDPYDPREYGSKDQTVVIGMASAYPGAGATFSSLALSSALSRSGVSHALVECPGSDAELYALLNGTRRMPKGAVFAQANGQQAAAPAWRSGQAAYYPLEPNETGSQPPQFAFASWLRRLGTPIVVLDLSSRWEQPAIKEWMMRSVDQLAIIADCYPMKWSGRRQQSCMDILKLAKQRNIRSFWIANRDQPFPDRKQWLSLFPDKPEIYIPDLAGPAMLDSLWRGEGLSSNHSAMQKVEQAFKPWIVNIAKRR